MKIEELVTTLRAKSLCEINIGGDFNIDLMKKDAKCKQYIDFLKHPDLRKSEYYGNVHVGHELMDFG